MAQLARGQQHILDEAEHAVLLDLLRRGECLLELLADGIGRVQDIDLGVGVASAHLSALETRHHRVHQVCALLVANLGEDVLRKRKDLALIDSSELYIHVEVLLIKRLHERVDKTTERRVLRLFNDLSTGSLGVALTRYAGQPKQVHHVVGREFIGGSEDEFELVNGYVDGLEEGSDDVAVVFSAELDELDRCFEIVEEAVDICEQDLHVAASAQELGDLQDRYKLQSISTRPPTILREGSIRNRNEVSLLLQFPSRPSSSLPFSALPP